MIACSFFSFKFLSDLKSSLLKIFLFPFLNSSRISITFISGTLAIDILSFILANLNLFSYLTCFQVFREGVALPNMIFTPSLFALSKASSLAS